MKPLKFRCYFNNTPVIFTLDHIVEIYEGDWVQKFFKQNGKWNDNALPVFQVKWIQQHCGYGIATGDCHKYVVVKKPLTLKPKHGTVID